MHLHPQKHGSSTCKSVDVDACADVDTDQCSYVLYNSSFCNSTDADTDADWSILAIRGSEMWNLCLFSGS